MHVSVRRETQLICAQSRRYEIASSGASSRVDNVGPEAQNAAKIFEMLVKTRRVRNGSTGFAGTRVNSYRVVTREPPFVLSRFFRKILRTTIFHDEKWTRTRTTFSSSGKKKPKRFAKTPKFPSVPVSRRKPIGIIIIIVIIVSQSITVCVSVATGAEQGQLTGADKTAHVVRHQ